MTAPLPDILPVFPLPGLVLFPGAQMPLHIFEPRYREMLDAALDGDRILVLALLKPGWEDDYYGTPALHAVACAGRIVSAQKLPDGRSYVTLCGLTRVRLLEEVPGLAFRRARVETLTERAEWLASPGAASAIPELLVHFQALQTPQRLQPGDDWKPEPAGLEMLLNSMCMLFPGDGPERQELLEIDDLEARFRRLAELIRQIGSRKELLTRWRRVRPENPELN